MTWEVENHVYAEEVLASEYNSILNVLSFIIITIIIIKFIFI